MFTKFWVLRIAALALVVQASCIGNCRAGTIGFADTIIEFFDSGAGPLAGPYGGTFPGSFPVPVSLDVVLGDEPAAGFSDFLSLPTGSFVTVGFTDETVIDGPGDDIFITEVGAAGETAEVFVRSGAGAFVSLGIANDSVTTAFDLASIGFVDPVDAVKIVGLDAFGSSPGFDVVNIRVLPGSIGPPPPPPVGSVPEPGSLAVFGLIGLTTLASRRNRAGRR